MNVAVIIGLCFILAVGSASAQGCMKSSSHGSSTGTGYEDNAGDPCGVTVTGFNIRHGELIDGLQIEYEDSAGQQVLGAWGGRTFGGSLVQIDFASGEQLKAITGMSCTNQVHYSGTYIRQLIFTTIASNGNVKVYGPYGDPTGSFEKAACQVFTIAGDVRSVFGKEVQSSSSGDNLGAIGAYLSG